MKDTITNMISKSPLTFGVPINSTGKFGNNPDVKMITKGRFSFIRGLTQLFGFRKRSPGKSTVGNPIEFVKVDSNSNLRISQGKAGKVFNTGMSTKLEELFDFWMRDTTDSQQSLSDRQKRISEIVFALQNDPFLSMSADLYADEATQIDVQGKLIQIDCADHRMKERMEDLLEQWGVTQNRLRSVAYNLVAYGDAFWANKVTKNGVIRISPLSIHQVKERLEFSPVQVQEQISLQKGYMTAISRDQRLKQLFDIIEDTKNEEFADLFDTRLFGFVLNDDMVVPPWTITHFRLNIDQSEYFPMGKSVFLKALAPFRQCNATMVLQSLARVMSFPVTVYGVKTAIGMDEALQFDKVNQIREEYENIGDASAGVENFSVNTKIWAPDGLLNVEVFSPNIDINATSDIEMYQDRVVVASGVPKGYLVQEWGGFGNSAISLTEQFKPFARRVFTVQSAILEGLSNLFKLHAAITGEFDYKEPFILSMKFPNEESSDQKLAAKQNSLNLSKDVLETISTIVGAFDDPLPPEVIQDILQKFSFLDPADIKKWVRYNPNKIEKKEQTPEELGDEMGSDLGGSIGGDIGTMSNLGGEDVFVDTPEDNGGDSLEDTGELPDNLDFKTEERLIKRQKYQAMEKKILTEKRKKTMLSRLQEAETILTERAIKEFANIDEAQLNDRHFKYSRLESCNEPMYKVFMKEQSSDGAISLKEEVEEPKESTNEGKFTWNFIKARINEGIEEKGEQKDEISPEDQMISQNIQNLIS